MIFEYTHARRTTQKSLNDSRLFGGRAGVCLFCNSVLFFLSEPDMSSQFSLLVLSFLRVAELPLVREPAVVGSWWSSKDEQRPLRTSW